MIRFSDDCYLDCYDKFKAGECMASYANSPHRAFSTVTRTKAKANCRLVVDYHSQRRSAKLVCGWDRHETPAGFTIERDTELLWNYEEEYIFPS